MPKLVPGLYDLPLTRELRQALNGNGISDAGWTVNGSFVPDNFGATEDAENTPLTIGSGDGFIVQDEYRGFVVGGSHLRTDPATKDLFLVMDPGLTILDNVIRTTGLRVHHASLSEVAADPQGFRPVINPNVVTGSTLQRGLRVRERTPSPNFDDPATGLIVPAHTALRPLAGFKFHENDNYLLIPSTGSVGNESPNETMVVEVFPQTFTNDALYYGTTAPPIPLGDDVDMGNGLIDRGPNGVLETDPVSPGHFRAEVTGVCNSTLLYPLDIASTVGNDLRRAVIGHEMGHGIHIDHSAICGELMWHQYDVFSGPFAIPTVFSPSDVSQIELR